MQISTAVAAAVAGVSSRTIRRYVEEGILAHTAIGKNIAVYERQVYALEHMQIVGARWSERTQHAALDLLSGIRVTSLEGSELSRLKSRMRSMTAERLAGALLVGHVSMFRATAAQHREIGSAIARDLGLAGIGTSVLVAERSVRSATLAGLVPDGDGDAVAVEGRPEHRAAFEALSLFVYGNTRERSAAASWIDSHLSSL